MKESSYDDIDLPLGAFETINDYNRYAETQEVIYLAPVPEGHDPRRMVALVEKHVARPDHPGGYSPSHDPFRIRFGWGTSFVFKNYWFAYACALQRGHK
jgi:hypothetical protein